MTEPESDDENDVPKPSRDKGKGTASEARKPDSSISDLVQPTKKAKKVVDSSSDDDSSGDAAKSSPAKKAAPVHIKDDFNPFKFAKVVDSANISA